MIAQRMKKLQRGFRLNSKQPPIDKTKHQWPDLMPHVTPEYDTENPHRITGMTPADAKKPSSEADAKMAMEMVAIR